VHQELLSIAEHGNLFVEDKVPSAKWPDVQGNPEMISTTASLDARLFYSCLSWCVLYGKERTMTTITKENPLQAFTGFPYLVTKIDPAIYHLILLPEARIEELHRVASLQFHANRLPTCLVLGPHDGIYFQLDGSLTRSHNIPCGGTMLQRKLRPARDFSDRHEVQERQLALDEFLRAVGPPSDGTTTIVMGDVLKGGRVPTDAERRRLRGIRASGVPRGIERCTLCGEWRGECIDPNPLLQGIIVPVHCLCENDNRCAACGELLHARKLNSNYFNEADGHVWHVPGLSAFHHSCGTASESPRPDGWTLTKIGAEGGDESARRWRDEVLKALPSPPEPPADAEALKLAEGLRRPFTQVLFGDDGAVVRIPRKTSLDVRQWLTQATHDRKLRQEIKEGVVQFIEDHFPVEPLVYLEWSGPEYPPGITWELTISVVESGDTGYMLVRGDTTHTVAALVEPFENPALIGRIVTEILTSDQYIDYPPTHWRTERPDLIPNRVLQEAVACVEERWRAQHSQ
jgi:hypothetical protein